MYARIGSPGSPDHNSMADEPVQHRLQLTLTGPHRRL
jgi:hypothetical protein